MSDDLSYEHVDEEQGRAVAAMHHVVRAEEWALLSGTGAAARGRSRRMRRTRYAATAGSAVAVTGVAVLVASTFGGGGSTVAAPAGGVTHHTTSAPVAAHVPQAPAKTTASQPTMGTVYYDKWKTCPVENLTVGQNPPGVTLPSTSTKVWLDACHRMVSSLSALNPGADVSPATDGWVGKNIRTLPPPPGVLGRDAPVPADLSPTMGPAMYRIEDAKGTVVLAFHSSGAHESDKPARSVPVAMVDGLRAWIAFPDPKVAGAMGEFYVTKADGQGGDAYALLMSAPPTFTADDFKALVTAPGFEQMMAGNLAEPNF